MNPGPGLVGLFKKLTSKNTTDNVTEEEIMSMVNEGHEQGVLMASEAEMITNIFEFGDKEAKDIMMHRKNIVAVNAQWTLEETVRFMIEENHSRFPVYEGDLDNIIGILNFKDVMIIREGHAYDQSLIKDIPDLLRQAYFIPETRNISDLFKEMQSQKIHMEIVIDEYGQTSGLIAMEDILEEIVGNILDEYDEEEDSIVKVADNVYNVTGMTPLEELEDKLSMHFEVEDDYDTLNGYLISKLDKIPQDNEVYEIDSDGYHFKVLSVEDKMIALVQVTILS
ncbi:MAG: hemolysin family protein [Eubacterium sp.]